MRIGDVGRSVCMFALVGATLVTAISCGGSGSSETAGDASFDGTFVQINLEAGVTNNCKPKTCAQEGFTCGWNSDGCGNPIQCGPCTAPAFCGGGGYSKCGNPSLSADGGPACVAKTCTDFPPSTCGQQADGCGGLTANCTTCTSPAFCGGGGPSLCGTGDAGSDAGTCIPKTCTNYPTACGQQSDGCGSLTADCGGCTNPEFCGGNPAAPGTCGGNNGLGPDGGPVVPPCVPKTCAGLGNPCGVAGDGCGGLTPVCTTCTSPAFCGGGGPSQCGTGSDSGTGGGTDSGTGGSCTPKTCASYPANTCGSQSDGCGGLTANCGTCTNPAYCGGGGPGLCGGNDGKTPDGAVASQCIPKTCAGLGYNCGQAGDGCGGIIGPCGPACLAPQVCGGGGSPNVCGSNLACTGLCQQQVACDGGTTTTLTGIVRSGLQEGTTSWVPAGTVPDPVPGVIVYIPTTAVTPFDSNPSAPQVQCSQCGADVSGNPLVETTTDYTGKFTLTNVPVSANAGDTIPIVIQLGHWRRQYSFAILNPCAQNTLPHDLNLPSSSTEGDIPLTAISTGSYDPIECVLLKMGINQNEFMSYTTWNAETAVGTAPKQGRVHIYTATAGGGNNSNPGATLAPQLDETVLMGTAAGGDSATNGHYMMYDQILLPCWGGPAAKNASELYDLGYYGDHGGHFFATHFSYSWLSGNNNSQLNTIANWDLRADDNATNGGVNGTPFTGDVSNTVPPTVPVTNPGVFVQWLNYVGALSNGNPAGAPPGAPTVTITAGRHDVDSVANGSIEWIDGTDPNGVVNSHATPPTAEMLLHFTFDMPIAATSGQCGHGIFSDFHVNSATQSNGKTFPNECDRTALNSQERIIEYMIWDLASCVPGAPTATCTPKTCANYPAGTCGQQGDGCGGLTANCSTCPTGQACGGCGVAGQCCAEDAGTCTPATCASFTGACGQQSDGCGGLTADCTCPAGQACVSGTCQSPPDGGSSGGCVPMTCAAYPAGTCGQQSDGCGGLTPDCNPCPMGQTCGGCGVSGMCCTPPSSMCTPQPCPAGVLCGPASDGCGGVIASCGTCMPPQTCGGGGMSGVCGGNSGCVPETCAQQSITCGPAGDGCGNLIANGCGPCPNEGGSCVPQTCAQLNINCGPAGDGCGNLIPTCGSCTPPATCGGGGVSGQCGTPIAQ